MIETMTIILVGILCAMLVLLGILCILYFKSKKQKEGNELDNKENAKSGKTTKTFTVGSVLDFMEFDKVEDNMISVKNGSKYVMVIECQGINYDLMSSVEKNAVEEGFIQFLNTLRHPIQIYTQTRTINLENSIQNYRAKVAEIQENLEKEKKKYEQMVESGRYTKEQLNAEFYELTKATNLYEYGKDIINTTEKMSLNKSVLSQKYYIAVPYYPEDLGETNFDKQEIRNLAFSELYTRAQSVIRTLAVCGVNGRVLNSNELVDLLYVAYNRDDSEVYGVDRALNAGYNELYSTAEDVVDKKMKALDEQIEKEAFNMANEKVMEARSEKEIALQAKEDDMDDLIARMAELIIQQNEAYIGSDIAETATEKVQEEAKKRRGRPRKNANQVEGGTKDNEQEKETKRRVTKTA